MSDTTQAAKPCSGSSAENDSSQGNAAIESTAELLAELPAEIQAELREEVLEEVREEVQEALQDELRDLRKLLFGGEMEELLNPPLQPEAVSQVLADAMLHAGLQDKLTDAVMPTIEAAIQSSVQRDSNVLSDALFPVIGPAARKSITAAIGNLVQSLNQTLEHSLSPQSFRWRLEAKRTGKSFAEVVMLRTLLYQVEQVFLIHKASGLVLQHIVAETAIAQDPDLVSAMLTAIQDFVRDSFTVSSGESLDTLTVGDFTLWMEEGPQAVIACVIRGTAPQDLRAVLRSTQEKIHLVFKKALLNFKGDQSAFEDSRSYLEDCLQSRFKAPEKVAEKPAPAKPKSKAQKLLIGLAIGLIFLGLGGWAFLGRQAHQRWEAYVAQVEQQPGLVVVSHGKQKGDYFITGLRDPLAADPALLLQATTIDPQKVRMSWEPYISSVPQLMGDRAKAILNPPETVALTLDQNQILHLAGSAPEAWIKTAQQRAQQLYGIAGWDDTQLTAVEREAVEKLRDRLETRRFAFEPGRAELRVTYQEALREQADALKTLIQIADTVGQRVEITLYGYGDRQGEASVNLQLGKMRASYIRRFLLNYGVRAAVIESKGFSRPAQASPLPRGQESVAAFKIKLIG